MKPPTKAAVHARVENVFPELSMRESWSVAPDPRCLRYDTIHLQTEADWQGVKAQLTNLLADLPGVTVGWMGAEIEVLIERRTRHAVLAETH